jgi:hypothetical protein
MTARLLPFPSARRPTLAVVASALAVLSLSLGAVGAQAAPARSAVNLCVKKSGSGKGTIRLVSAKKCPARNPSAVSCSWSARGRTA